MRQVNMTAEIRQSFGKGAARTFRREGMTPAVLYAIGSESKALKLDTKSFTQALLSFHGQNAVITLDMGEEKRHVMVKEIQTDPIHDTLMHADFYEVSLEESIALPVVVQYVGKAKGVDLGGVLHIVRDKVMLKGLVLELPDVIEVDVTALLMGDRITCGELALPGNVSLVEDENALCVSVIEPSKEVEEVVEEEEEAAAEGEAEGEAEGKAEGKAEDTKTREAAPEE
ncbi:MAG: 50S ribosomal protein L25 [Desulfobulbaceae bacterium]|nr:50S ribosomal protein L25 [Desulfobulbaceae bacterium]